MSGKSKITEGVQAQAAEAQTAEAQAVGMQSAEKQAAEMQSADAQPVEMLHEDALRAKIRTAWAGCRLVCYQKTDSTNVRAAQLAEEGAAHGMLVVADAQSDGRGRRGRSWASPKGKNVYFSLLLRPAFPPDKASMLTLVMALAVKETIEEVCGTEAKIKWPNDIVVSGKKVTGILTELRMQGTAIDHVVIGVGINVKAQAFAPEYAEHATSLETEVQRKISKEQLIAGVMAHFEKAYDLFLQTMDLSLLCEAYNAALVNCGREVRVLDPKGEYTGIAQGINHKGELLVQLTDKTVQEVYAGEVSVRGIYGYV